MKRQQYLIATWLVTIEGKRDSSGIGSCPKSLKTFIDLPETIQLYSVVLLKMKFNWNWVNGTTCRHDWIRSHRPRTLESQREYLIECAERVEDAKSYTVHFCKSQYDRNHHCLVVSLSLTLDEAMRYSVPKRLLPLTLKV